MSKTRRFTWSSRFRSALLLVLLGLGGWLLWPAPSSESATDRSVASRHEVEAAPTAVEAVAVARRDLSLTTEATGHIKPWRKVELSFDATGKVTWHGVQEGSYISKGDVLVQLDDREHRIEVAEAESEVLKGWARHALFLGAEGEGKPPVEKRNQAASSDDAEAGYRRARELFEQGLIAERELTEARRRLEVSRILRGDRQSEVQAATTGLVQAEHRLERARLLLERTRLEAPFSGRVADVTVEIGQQVTAGQTCLVLLDESRVKVEVDVLESDVVWLRAGAPARVRVPALGRQVFVGRIHTVNPLIAEDSGIGRVTVVVDNPGGTLMPGLFAVVELEKRRLDHRLVVPAAAVLNRQGRELVFRLEAGRALWSYVVTGVRSGDEVEIEEGLAAGDVVAVAGHFALAHETPVAVVARTTAMAGGGGRP